MVSPIGPNEARFASSDTRIDNVREENPLNNGGVIQGDGQSTPSVSFGDILGDVVGQANRMDHIASQKVEDLARGVSDDLHGTMIATKEADISVKLVGSIRNKLLDAFQEIWRTSV